MSSDMYGLADVIAAAMTVDHLQFLKGSAKEIRGIFFQRVLRDWGHAAHLGWARFLHDRRRDFIERHPHHISTTNGIFTPTTSIRTGSSFLLATSALGVRMPPVLPLILSSTPPPSREPLKKHLDENTKYDDYPVYFPSKFLFDEVIEKLDNTAFVIS